MDRFERFRDWYESADQDTREWCEKESGSSEIRDIFFYFSTLKYAHSRYGSLPSQYLPMFKFFPQILGVFHYRGRHEDELFGPDLITEGFEVLPDLKNIRELSLKISPAEFAKIPPLPHITHLSLQCEGLDSLSWIDGWDNLINLTISGLAQVGEVPRDTNLSTLFFRSDASDLSKLSNFTKLTTLQIIGGELDQNLDLSHCRDLMNITLSNLTFNGLLVSTGDLVSLRLDDCGLRGGGICAPSIKRVSIHSDDPRLWTALERIDAVEELSVHANNVNIHHLPDDLSDLGIKQFSCSFSKLENFAFDGLGEALERLRVVRTEISNISGRPSSKLQSASFKACGLSESQTDKIAEWNIPKLDLRGNILGAAFLSKDNSGLTFDTHLKDVAQMEPGYAKRLFKRHLALGGHEHTFSTDDEDLTRWLRHPWEVIKERAQMATAAVLMIAVFGFMGYQTIRPFTLSADEKYRHELRVWENCVSDSRFNSGDGCGEMPERSDASETAH